MLEEYLQFNIATAKELQNNCNLTARQVHTRLKKLGDKIIKIPNGKAPKYALTMNAFGVGDKITIWEVDNFGKHSAIAILRPLSCGGYFVEKFNLMPAVFYGENGNGFYDDLPYFLRDMAPKGFLGKKIALQLATLDDSFPRHLNEWKNEHIGRYLLANDNANIGNLKFGNNTNLNIKPNFVKNIRAEYPQIADDIINNDTVISSAGGEQQKFTTFCTEENFHVIVKFSPKGDSENARRWQDILITEHCANLVLNGCDIPAAQTHLFKSDGRLFLESKRFDRVGEFGKRSMLSLTMIDCEFCGVGDDWLKSSTKLYEQKLLNFQDLVNVEILSIFAKFINNTDTHLGNISFATCETGFSLLPIYDMCSMGFAPKSNGEVIPFSFKKPSITAKYCTDSLENIQRWVKYFWNKVLDNQYTSTEFKTFIKSNII